MHAHTHEKYHEQIFCFLFFQDHIVIYKTKSKDMYHTCMHTHMKNTTNKYFAFYFLKTI